MELEQCVSTEYAAALLMVTPTTVRRWIKAGRLPAFRVGKKGRYRIRVSDLQALSNERLLKGIDD